MKFLARLTCWVVFALIYMILTDAGIKLGGAIPMCLFVGLVLWVEEKWCFRIDLNRLAKKARAKGMTTNELVKAATPKEVLEQCESLKDRKELKYYLKQQLEWGTITKLHMKVLFDHYK